MLKVVEAFSGIGAQKQALEEIEDIGIQHEILNTIEWDINAIIAYDIMHHTNNEPSNLSKKEIIDKLSNFTLSSDGKNALSNIGIKQIPEKKLQQLEAAIRRNDNLCDITKVTGQKIPDDTDLLTYSFPCQDLSIGSAFHNFKNDGITKGAGTRSGLLWEIERILQEKKAKNLPLPKFLLMENVNAIYSPRHKGNFKLWRKTLENMGYVNKVYKAKNARNFGVPQNRSRTFMLSVLSKKITEVDIDNLDFDRPSNLAEYLRLTDEYAEERQSVTPNQTDSRKKIGKENKLLVKDGKIVAEFTNTISTKQDRNPNAGVIISDGVVQYLTPRETFLLMGFPKEKIEKLLNISKSRKLFSNSHLYRMAGNSIVVNILVEIFKEIDRINKELFDGE